jgi:nitrogen-specific signal transduction histidine kinase/ActR/RegA family two-component response regulator
VVPEAMDVTARVSAEAALHQAQKMEAIGNLSGGIAHDFNNLLMAVLGSLELLRKKLPEDPKTQRLISNAVEGATRGVALTQRMLSFARRQDLRPEPVDLPNLVRGMGELLTRSIGPSVRIETHFPLGLPKAMVDANQLALALLNLVLNARDAMPNGGAITIGAREDAGAAQNDPGEERYVCLSVADSGMGMDEETLRRAQEPFFTTKGVGKGTGLGLSMAHGLAEQSRGRLTIESRLGQGTTAEIWLPTAPAEAARPKSVLHAEPARGAAPSLSVLVVDDDPLVLENTVALLEDLGHRAAAAGSGREAMDQLAHMKPPDLVLTDYAMPEITGLKLAEWIRSAHPHVRILMMTGFADIPAGAPLTLPKLSKPFDQAALAAAIEALTDAGDGRGEVVPFRSKGG